MLSLLLSPKKRDSVFACHTPCNLSERTEKCLQSYCALTGLTSFKSHVHFSHTRSDDRKACNARRAELLPASLLDYCPKKGLIQSRSCSRVSLSSSPATLLPCERHLATDSQCMFHIARNATSPPLAGSLCCLLNSASVKDMPAHARQHRPYHWRIARPYLLMHRHLHQCKMCRL